MKVLIVGGVAAGASCAARIRRLDEEAEIVIIERTGYISYANCGLPYYVGGVITGEEDLSLQNPESFWKRFRIDVRVRQEVQALHTKEKEVIIKNLVNNEEYIEHYDKLVLAPGAKPTLPQLSGVESNRILSLRTVEDTLHIRNYIEKNAPENVVIAGGGFIGMEVAENLRDMGIDVTIVQKPNQLLAPLDFDMACILHAEMRRAGVKLKLGKTVLGFQEHADYIETLLDGEETLQSSLVILAIGVTPDTDFIRGSDVLLGQRGSIITNEKMETSVKDIYAAGDAVEVTHYVTGKKALVSLAGPANKQGRIIADNLCGGNATYQGAQGSSVIKVFRLTAASTGINEKMAKQMEIDSDFVILHPASHASYYPGASTMTMKVLFEKKTNQLLGAQIVGYEGVDKRIDVIATAMRAGMKAVELAELDLAYAPPYASAKDPVNMSGYIIENLVTDKIKQCYYKDLENWNQDENILLLDARTVYEYRMGHIEGAKNIPLDDLREHIDELEKNKKIYVLCQSGLRSYLACRILKQHGFDVYNFTGGYRYYLTVKNEMVMQEETYPCGMDKI